jgi:polar amino acid transport system substrate-binding protein
MLALRSVWASLFVLQLLASGFMPTKALADTISIVADPWMPFTGDGKPQKGLLIDIAEAVFEAKGHKIDYKVVPWDRALENTKSGKYNGAAGAYKTDAPDFIFPESELSRGDSRFFVAKSDPWKFSGTASLEGKKLGAISGYTYSDVINEYIKKNQGSGKVSLVSGDKTPTQRLVSMLLSNPQRVNVVVEDVSVIRYALKKLGLPPESLLEAGDDGKPDEGIFIAFSPKNPKSKEYAKILSEGMTELRKSGKLKILLEKYGLKDWQ